MNDKKLNSAIIRNSRGARWQSISEELVYFSRAWLGTSSDWRQWQTEEKRDK